MKSLISKLNESDELPNIVGKYYGRDVVKILKNELKDRWFTVFNYRYSYAEGITGSNRYRYILTGDGTGFASKKDAVANFKSRKDKFKTVITQKDQGYGALGKFYGDPKFVTGAELVELNNDARELEYVTTRTYNIIN